MNKRHASAFILASLILMAPAVAAEPGWRAELEASGLHAGPETTLTTQPVLVSAERGLPVQPMLPADFTLSAERLHVELDTTELAVRTGASLHRIPGNTTRTDYTHADVEGLRNGDSYRIIAVPLTPNAILSMSTHCSNPIPSEEDTAERLPLARTTPQRDPVRVDVSDAVRWNDCSQNARLQVQGDFLLGLWDWDLQVRHGSETTVYETGQEQHPSASDLPDAGGTVSQDREAWLYVYNGTLEFTLVQGAQHTLYTQPTASLHTRAGLLFEDAAGEIRINGKQHHLGGREVYLRGDLDAALQQTPQGNVRAVVEGELQGVVVDEAALALPSLPANASSAAWWASLGLMAVVLVALAAWLGNRTPLWLYHPLRNNPRIQRIPAATPRQRRAAVLGCCSDWLLTRIEKKRGARAWMTCVCALWLAHRAHRLDPDARVHLVWRSWALARLGAYRKALRDCRVLDVRLRGPYALAMNAWRAAQCAEALGNQGDAEVWRRRANEVDARAVAKKQRVARGRAPAAPMVSVGGRSPTP